MPPVSFCFSSKFERPVTVIVPVYNAVRAFEGLLDSLLETFPSLPDNLHFSFIDDNSPDEEIDRLWNEHPFLKVIGVYKSKNAENLGFVGTVNEGMAACNKNHDVLLLNSDTLVYGNAFAILQQVAYSRAEVASVSPLTNNCTISSLCDWPNGTNSILDLSPREISQIVEEANLPTPFHTAPTGVGFCLYLTRRALDLIGNFDQATFGRGYGEENDWCQRAAKKGFVNLICPGAFVFHQGTQSFASQEKAALVRKNLRLLARKHINYFPEVEKYLSDDPLRSHRAEILWRLTRLKKGRAGFKTVAFLLHECPDHFSGGTEGHVKSLSEQLLKEGKTEVFQIFRAGDEKWRLRIGIPNQEVFQFDFIFSAERFAELFDVLAPEMDALHVHHMHGASLHELAVIRNAKVPRKIFTAHDFLPLCPSINLIGPEGSYCHLPDEKTCNGCLKYHHQYQIESIAQYRDRMKVFLDSFDSILVPSESAYRILKEGFIRHEPQIASPQFLGKISVLENALPYAEEEPRKEEKNLVKGKERTVVFLGAIGPHKGAGLLPRAVKKLFELGFRCEIWGLYSGKELDDRVVERKFRSWQELSLLAKKHRPFAVCMPSVWPETFSYTAYEALCLLEVPIIVGPYGNPAQLVRSYKVGVTMAKLSPKAIARAAAEVANRYEEFMNNIRRYRSRIVQPLKPEGIFESLKDIYALSSVTKPDRVSSDWYVPPLSPAEVQSRRSSRLATDLEYKLQRIESLRGYRILKKYYSLRKLARKLFERIFRIGAAEAT